MTIRDVGSTTLKNSLMDYDPFIVVHLIKFERPKSVGQSFGTIEGSPLEYTYITDAQYDIEYLDGSVPVGSSTANPAQKYRANKILNLGTVNENIQAKASNLSLTLDAASLGHSAAITCTFSGSNKCYITDPSTLEGFQEGDKVLFTGASQNTGKYVRIDSFIIDGTGTGFKFTPISGISTDSTAREYTLSQSSEEITSLLANKPSSYTSYINREVIIYRAHLNPTTREIIGQPYLYFKGITSKASVKEKLDSSSITWTLTSHWGDFLKVTGRMTDDSFHRALSADGSPDLDALIRPEYATDLGFLHSNTAINHVSTYKTTETRTRMKKRGGVAGAIGLERIEEYEVEVEKDVNLAFNPQAKMLPVVYGVRKIGSFPVFVDTDKDASDKVYKVDAICEGPVAGLLDLYVEGSSQICLDLNDYNTRNPLGTGYIGDQVEIPCYGRQERGDALSGYVATSGSLLNSVTSQSGDNSNVVASINDDAYQLPSFNSVATGAALNAGINHDETHTLVDPISAHFTFHSGQAAQKADPALVDLAVNNKFKIQNTYYDQAADYWSPSHRLLDTAYVTGKYTIAEGETTIPDIEYIIRGRDPECYNYDGSYIQDLSQNSSAFSNFNLGDNVTFHRTDNDSPIGTSTFIIDKWTTQNSNGVNDNRFRVDTIPDLGTITSFYMKKTSGGNRWYTLTWDHSALSGNVVSDLTHSSFSTSAGTTRGLKFTLSGTPTPAFEAAINNSNAIVGLSSNSSPYLLSSNYSNYSYNTSSNVLDNITGFANSSAPTFTKITVKNALKVDSGLNSSTAVGSSLIVTDTSGSVPYVQERTIIGFDSSQNLVFVDSPWDYNRIPTTSYKYEVGFKGDKRVTLNPSMQLLDYLTNNRYGKGLNRDNEIDLESWKEAGRKCDTRSDVTLIVPNGSTIAKDDIFKISNGAVLRWQGKVKKVETSIGGTNKTQVTFTNVIGKVASKWNNYDTFIGGDYYWWKGVVYTKINNGQLLQEPDGSTSSVSTFYIQNAATSANIAVDQSTSASDGNPLVKKYSTNSASFSDSGYSIYDSDNIKYWKYVGWDSRDQRNVTRHQLNQIIDTTAPVFSNINNMLSQFNGILRYSSGKYQLDIKSTQGTITSEEKITEEDIIGSITLEDSGIKGSKNSCTASIIDPGNKFESRSISFFNSDYLKEDKGIKKNASYKLDAITNYFNARLNIKQYLDESRYGLSIKFKMAPRGLLLLSGSIFELTYPRFGYTNKAFRITNLNFQKDGTVDVTAQEHNDEAYIVDLVQGFKGITEQVDVGQAPESLPIPTRPTNLAATQSNQGEVILTWTNSSTFSSATHMVEIYRSSNNNFAAVNDQSQPLASLIGTSATDTFHDPISEGQGNQTRYYWIRYVVKVPRFNLAGTKFQNIPSRYYPDTQDSGFTNGEGVTGVGLATNAVRAIKLHPGAATSFVYQTGGTGLESGYPSQSILTTTRTNISGTESFVWKLNGNIISGANGNQFTYIPPNAFTDMPQTITVEVTDTVGSETFVSSDSLGFTATRIVNNAVDGINGYTITATNGTHNFSASSVGAIASTTTFASDFRVLRGDTVYSYDDSSSPATNTFSYGTISYLNAAHVSAVVSTVAQTLGQITINAATGTFLSGTSVMQTTFDVPIIDNSNSLTIGTFRFNLTKTLDGADGTPGVKTALIYAYQRSATALTSDPGAVTVNLNTGTISSGSLANGWKKNIDETTGTDSLYVCAVTAAGTGASDSIAATEWTDPVVLVSNGVAQKTVFIFSKNDSDGAVGFEAGKSASDQNFATPLTGLELGWSTSQPTLGDNNDVIYMSQRTFTSDGSSPQQNAWEAPVVAARRIDGTSFTVVGSVPSAATANVRFRFEKNPYPDTEPSHNTANVLVSGSTEQSYSVTIPTADVSGETFTSLLLYVSPRDVPVNINNFTLNASSDTGSTLEPNFSEAFGGFTIVNPPAGVNGAVYEHPTGTEPWAGVANSETSLINSAISFSSDGSMTFDAFVPNANSNAQTTLNTAFGSAIAGDAVIAQDSGNLWIYDGTSWDDVGQIKGDHGVDGINEKRVYLFLKNPTLTNGNPPAVTADAGQQTYTDPTDGVINGWTTTQGSLTTDADIIYMVQRAFTSSGTGTETSWSSPIVVAQKVDGVSPDALTVSVDSSTSGEVTLNFSNGATATISDGSDGTTKGVKPLYAATANPTQYSQVSLTQGTNEFVNFYEYTGTFSALNDTAVEALTFVKIKGEDGDNEGVIPIYANDSDNSDGQASFTQGSRTFVNFYEWTGSAPSSVPGGLTYTKFVGSDGGDGLNVSPVFIYKRTNSASETSKPSGNSIYTFSSGSLTFTTANGWSATPPGGSDTYLWYRTATASANTSTDTIPDSEWADAQLLAVSGADGDGGVRGGSIFNIEENGNANVNSTHAEDFAGTINANAAQAVAAAVIALSQDGHIRPNDRITVTDNSASKAGTRVYTGTATSANTSVTASDFSSLVVETFDGSVIVDGTLSADKLTANTTLTNNLNVGSTMVLGSSGKFHTTNKTTFDDNDAGFWLGYESGAYKLNVGNSSNHLKWDGSNLGIAGSITVTGGPSMPALLPGADDSEWQLGTVSTKQGIWTKNGTSSENTVVYEAGPFGDTARVWKSTSTDGSDADGGFSNSSNIQDRFSTEDDVIYRFTTFVKQSDTDGTVYFGAYNFDDSDANIRIHSYDGSSVADDSAGGNAYFWAGDLPTQNEWYFFVGYINPSNTSINSGKGGLYKLSTGNRVIAVDDFRFNSSAEFFAVRTYQFFSSLNSGATVRWAHPRVDRLDRPAPSLPQLLAITGADFRSNLTKADVGLADVDNDSTQTIREGTTKENVGLGNVDNDSTSTIRSGTTKENVGLGNVDNDSTSTIRSGTTKENVGLGNVDNDSTQTIREGTTKENVGLGNVDNESSLTIRQQVTVNSDGTLSGAGTGSVTAAGLGAETIQINTGGTKTVTVKGNKIVASGTEGWDTHAFTKDGYPAAVATWVVPNTNKSQMAGLTTEAETSTSFDEIDYAWYMQTGALKIFEGGSEVSLGTTLTYSAGDKLTVAYDGVNLRYYHNGEIKRTVETSIGNALYFDSSFYSDNATIEKVHFAAITDISSVPKASVGLSNVDNNSTATIRSGTTKENVGLGNVDNKSASTIQSETLTAATSSDVGLGNVDNNSTATILSGEHTGNVTGTVNSVAVADISSGAALGTSSNQDSTSTIRSGTTKENVGLGNVDNDSTATIRSGTTKANVGLGSVDDKSAATIQSETLTAATSSDVGLGNVDNNSTATIRSGTTKENVGLGNVDNNSTATILSGEHTGTVTGNVTGTVNSVAVADISSGAALGTSSNQDSTSTIRSGTTKENVGLGNVDNDSTATIRSGTTKANVGLGSVDDKSAATIQSETLTAATASDVGLGNVDNNSTATIRSGTTKENVGLGNVDNDSTATILSGEHTGTVTGNVTGTVNSVAVADISSGAALGTSSNQDSTATIRSGTTKANVGLGSVDDKSAATIQSETLTAATSSDVGLGNVDNNSTATIRSGTTKENVGLGNVDNNSTATILSGEHTGTVTGNVTGTVNSVAVADISSGAALGTSSNQDSTSTIRSGTTKENVGLGNVDNNSTATIRSGTTKENVGLGNVDNDSTATIRSGTTKANVGLGSVDDKSAATIQSETLTAATSSDVGLGNVDNNSTATIRSGTTKENVGLGNVDNDSTATIRSGTTKANVGLGSVDDKSAATIQSETLTAATSSDVGLGNVDNNSTATIRSGTTKENVGLGNVDNDSTATIRSGTTKANVGLGSVDDKSAATIQSETLTAATSSDVGLGNVDNNSTATIRSGTTKENVGLGNVDNDSTATIRSGTTKANVGLGSVDDKSAATIQSETLTAATSSDVGLGNVDNNSTATIRSGTTKENVGLGNVDNDSTSTIRGGISLNTDGSLAGAGGGAVTAGGLGTETLEVITGGSKTVTVKGNRISVSGGSNGWNTHAYSKDGYPAASVTFVNTSTNKYFMMGLNTDPTTDTSYSSIDFQWYCRDDVAKIYEGNSQIGTFVADINVGDKFTVAYDGVNVKYYYNGEVKRTVLHPTASVFYMDSSFYHTGFDVDKIQFSQITDLSVIPKANVGLGNVDNNSTATIRSGTTKANVGLGSVDDKSAATIQSETLTAATSSDVGLGNVDNNSTATIRSGTTKENVGLGNVDNNSTATIRSGTTKANVGLGSVDDKSAATIQSETLTAATANDVGLGNVDNNSTATIRSGTTKENVGLGNVDNKSSATILGETHTGSVSGNVTGNVTGTVNNVAVSTVTDGAAQGKQVQAQQSLLPRADDSEWTLGAVGSGFDRGIWARNGAGGHENTIVLEAGPFGDITKVWKSISTDASSNDGGFHNNGAASRFPIEDDVVYRFSVFAKQSDTDGSMYFGGYNYQGDINKNLYEYNNTSGSTNKYWWNGDLPSMNEWYLFVGFINPHNLQFDSNMSGLYKVSTGQRVVDRNDLRFFSSADTFAVRTYLFYSSTNSGTTARWAHPRVDRMDRAAPSIMQILANENTVLNSNTTKENVGLGSVDNNSTATIRAGTTRENVGLGNINNPSSAVTPISAGQVNGNVTSIGGSSITTGKINVDRLNLDGTTISKNAAGNIHIPNLAVDTLQLKDQAVTIPIGSNNSTVVGGTTRLDNGSGSSIIVWNGTPGVSIPHTNGPDWETFYNFSYTSTGAPVMIFMDFVAAGTTEIYNNPKPSVTWRKLEIQLQRQNGNGSFSTLKTVIKNGGVTSAGRDGNPYNYSAATRETILETSGEEVTILHKDTGNASGAVTYRVRCRPVLKMSRGSARDYVAYANNMSSMLLEVKK